MTITSCSNYITIENSDLDSHPGRLELAAEEIGTAIDEDLDGVEYDPQEDGYSANLHFDTTSNPLVHPLIAISELFSGLVFNLSYGELELGFMGRMKIIAGEVVEDLCYSIKDRVLDIEKISAVKSKAKKDSHCMLMKSKDGSYNVICNSSSEQECIEEALNQGQIGSDFIMYSSFTSPRIDDPEGEWRSGCINSYMETRED